MRSSWPALAAFLLLCSSLPLAALAAPSAQADEIVVGFREAPPVERGQSFHGGTVEEVDVALRMVLLRTNDAPGLRERLDRDPRVRYHEENGRLHALGTPNDPLLGSQHAIAAGNLSAAWNITMGAAATRVCVVDSGVRATHEDIDRLAAQVDFVQDDGLAQDESGHGTHVASIATATAGNSVGIAGVAQSTLLVARVLGADGSGSYSDIAAGIRWCGDRGAHVITISIGGAANSASITDAVSYASAKGAIVIAASGNGGPCESCVSFPARLSSVLAVACVDAARAPCSFSSDGPEVDIAAPGQGILAAYRSADDSYRTMSGTSMSAPFVAGVAALLKSQDPSLSPAAIRARLLSTARDVGPAGHDTDTGAGVVDAGAALTAGLPPPPPEATAFDATFSGVKGNAWWVEARISANAPLAGVDARVGNGTWTPLTLRSWGAWAVSLRAPAGSLVQLRARAADGSTDVSGCYLWTNATSTSCSTTPRPPPPPPAFDATFSGVKGNAWWIETKVIASNGTLAKVEASVNGGAWKTLTLRSWGAWAVSTSAPDGSKVRLRATSSTGATDLSGCYRWTGATAVSC